MTKMHHVDFTMHRNRTYVWYKDQGKHNSGTEKDAKWKQKVERKKVLPEGIESNSVDRDNKGRYIDGNSDKLCIIQPLQFHLSDGEGERQCYHFQDYLISVEDTQCNCLSE